DGDPVILDDLPESGLVGPVGGALVHHDGGAVGQGTIGDVRMPRDPADVGRTPEGVVVLEVEDPLAGQRRAHEVAGGRVEDALGPAGRAGSVEDEQRVFAV